MTALQFIHDPWFVSLYPLLVGVFGLAFALGRFTARTPMDVRDREYKAGWEAGRAATFLEMKGVVLEALGELDALAEDEPNVLINRRLPAFFKRQAD